MRLVQLLLLLVSALNVSALVKVGFQFTGYGKLIFDPARTHMFVKRPASSGFDDLHSHHSVLYPDKNGDFIIPTVFTPPNSTLELTIESLDYLFPSPHFTLAVPSDTSSNTTIVQNNAMHLTLSKPSTTNITAPTTCLLLQSAQYGFYPLRFMASDTMQASPMQLIRSVPFLAPIVSSKWTIGVFILILSMAAIPYVINYLDPAFADRMLQAQIEQQKKEQKEHQQQEKKDN